MDAARTLPVLSIGLISVVALLSGPFGLVDLTHEQNPCNEDVFPGEGNASVDVGDAPDTATLTESRFGAKVYRLNVPPARMHISDVDGRPTLSYKVRIPKLSTELGSTTILSTCTTGERALSIQEVSFQPDIIQQERYNATLFVVYRGTEQGEDIERELLSKNVRIEVQE